MKIFLVDYENVGVNGLNGLSKLDANSKLVIFYSEHNDKLTFGLHKRLTEIESIAIVEYNKADISTGKNALDFQLSCYVGICLKEYDNCDIFIVSKDKGYDSLIKLARKYNGSVRRVDDITCYKPETDFPGIVETESVTGAIPPMPARQKEFYDRICNLKLKNFDPLELSKQIYEFDKKYKTKNTINAHISKLVKDNEVHSRISKAIKDLLKEKK